MMNSIEKILLGTTLIMATSSCSVQQFQVNTKAEPFQNSSRAFGENTKERLFKKSKDIHVLGFNVRNSDTKKMAEELDATAYTIETKTNYILSVLTGGIVNYKIVKVIKQDI